jgi:hypothetical protein
VLKLLVSPPYTSRFLRGLSLTSNVAGNYMVRYMFAAAGTAVCLPAVRKIGVGWFSTISAVFLVVATLATYVTTLKGKDWREAVDAKKAEKKEGENHV